MSRGFLTENIQEYAKNFLNREITIKELRLYPYIDYCLKNFNKIDLNKISKDEKDILDILMKENHLVYSCEKILCTKDFYYYLQKVLFDSYVEEHL